MNAAIFLVAGIAMMFAVGFVAAVAWLMHHMTDSLPLDF
jgi:hypothetical protein